MKQIIKNIGKAYFALLLTDTDLGATYDTTEYLEGLREITVTPTQNQGDVYAEGVVWDTDTEDGPINISFDVTDIPLETRAKLFGHKISTTGGVIDSQKDEAPYLALMYEKTLKDGVIEYVTLYKGKLMKPEDKGKTREGSVEYQTKTVSGRFIPLATGEKQHIERSDATLFVQATHDLTWGEGKTIEVADEPVTP